MKILKLVFAGIAGGLATYLGFSFLAMSFDWVKITRAEVGHDDFFPILAGRLLIIAASIIAAVECHMSAWYKGE